MTNENLKKSDSRNIYLAGTETEKMSVATSAESKKSSGRGISFWIILGTVIILIIASTFGMITYRFYKIAKDSTSVVSDVSKIQEKNSESGGNTGSGDKNDITRIFENQAAASKSETIDEESRDIEKVNLSESQDSEDSQSDEEQLTDDVSNGKSEENDDENHEEVVQEEYDFSSDIQYFRAQMNNLEPEDYGSVDLSDEEMGV